MSRLRRFLAVLSILALLPAAACDQAQIQRWCDTYTRGSAWAFAALPALDAASAWAPPAWVAVYGPAKAGLLTVHGRLVSFCERHRTGQALDREAVRVDLLEGVNLIAELIALQQQLGGTRGLDAAPTSGLLADLERVRVELEREAKRR